MKSSTRVRGRNSRRPHVKRERPSDVVALEAAVNRAVRDALRIHKKLGNPIAVWENGKVVILQPKDIPVDD